VGNQLARCGLEQGGCDPLGDGDRNGGTLDQQGAEWPWHQGRYWGFQWGRTSMGQENDD